MDANLVDQALLTLENAKSSRDRDAAAQLIVQLALEEPTRRQELGAHLPRLLADRMERVRRAGVQLGALVLDEDEAESFFADRLKDPSDEVRIEAAGQLADLARPSARGILAAALQDPVFPVRFEAARGMAALHHASGLDVLVEALSMNALRFRALGALAELGDPRALPAIQKVHRRWLLPGFERTQAAGAMARLGDPEGARYLMNRVLKRRGPDRALAVELLGEVRAPGAKERLFAVLDDTADRCRGAAARGLGRLGELSAVPRLLALLRSEEVEDDLRLDAAEALCLLEAPEAPPEIEAAAQHAPAELRAELRMLLEEYR